MTGVSTCESGERTLLDLFVAARLRDQSRCRWPEPHVCEGGLDVALIGPELVLENAVTVCAFIHRLASASILGGQLLIDKDTSDGANGCLSFWRRLTPTAYYCVGREVGAWHWEHD